MEWTPIDSYEAQRSPRHQRSYEPVADRCWRTTASLRLLWHGLDVPSQRRNSQHWNKKWRSHHHKLHERLARHLIPCRRINHAEETHRHGPRTGKSKGARFGPMKNIEPPTPNLCLFSFLRTLFPSTLHNGICNLFLLFHLQTLCRHTGASVSTAPLSH